MLHDGVDGQEHAERHVGQQQRQPALGTGAHVERARRATPAADHQAGPVQRHERRDLRRLQAQAFRRLQVRRQVADGGHFHADVDEDGDHAQHQLRVAQRRFPVDQLAAVLCFGFGQLLQVDVVGHRGELQEDRHQDEGHAQHQVRRLDALDAGFGAARQHAAEDRHADQQRADGGAEVVDATGQRQPLRAGLGVTDDDGQRIGRDLLQREAKAHDEQAGQHQVEGTGVGCGIEQQRAQRGDHQAQADAVLVADAVEQIQAHDLGYRHVDQRAYGVGYVERDGHVLALCLRQVEGFLEHRDQDVVAGRNEAPEEEHGDQHAELRPSGGLGGHVLVCLLVRYPDGTASLRSRRAIATCTAAAPRDDIAGRCANGLTARTSPRRRHRPRRPPPGCR